MVSQRFINVIKTMTRIKFASSLAAKCINNQGEITLIKDDRHIPVTPSFFSTTPELRSFEEGCRRAFKVNIRRGLK